VDGWVAAVLVSLSLPHTHTLSLSFSLFFFLARGQVSAPRGGDASRARTQTDSDRVRERVCHTALCLLLPLPTMGFMEDVKAGQFAKWAKWLAYVVIISTVKAARAGVAARHRCSCSHAHARAHTQSHSSWVGPPSSPLTCSLASCACTPPPPRSAPAAPLCVTDGTVVGARARAQVHFGLPDVPRAASSCVHDEPLRVRRTRALCAPDCTHTHAHGRHGRAAVFGFFRPHWLRCVLYVAVAAIMWASLARGSSILVLVALLLTIMALFYLIAAVKKEPTEPLPTAAGGKVSAGAATAAAAAPAAAPPV
jgi:hypothetical protein